MEIAFVELTGAVLFREQYHEGGIMAYQVYAVQIEQGIIVIRPVTIRHKKIGMCWLKKRFDQFMSTEPPFSRIERVKILINEIKIKKIFWKHEITESMYAEITKCLAFGRTIYDNKNNPR